MHGWISPVAVVDGLVLHSVNPVCKAHREYWQWAGQRNEERYTTNSQHGRGYDSKNLMHLLRVRAGEFEYEDLVSRAEEQLAETVTAFEKSALREQPDRERVNRLLVEIRESF
jgi:hypothetical protein